MDGRAPRRCALSVVEQSSSRAVLLSSQIWHIIPQFTDSDEIPELNWAWTCDRSRNRDSDRKDQLNDHFHTLQVFVLVLFTLPRVSPTAYCPCW